jgi:hypothetical protein
LNGLDHHSSKRPDHAGAETPVQSLGAPSAGGRYAGWIILAGYALFLVGRAVVRTRIEMANVPMWHLQDSRQLLAWIGGMVLGGLAQFAYFVVLGFVTAMAVGPGRRFRGSVSALAIACGLAVVVQAVEIGPSWHLAAMPGLALAILGCLFGVWVGATWLRGRRARLWLLPKIGALVLFVVFCMGIILSLSVQRTSLSFEPARVTSAEKRRLVYLVRSKSPRSLIEGQTRTLRLTEHDVNVLLAWGLSLGSPDRKARVSLVSGSASLVASVGLPLGAGDRRYLNLTVAAVPELQKGVLNLHIQRFKLGVMEAPRWLCKLVSPVVTSLLRYDRRSKPLLDAIQAVTIEPGSIEVTYGRLHLPAGYRGDIFGPDNTNKDVLASTRAQVEHLLTLVGHSPDTQPTFGECFETVFTFARDRSVEGDPLTENKAGIFALGIVLGHPRVEEFLGPVLDGRLRSRARRILGHVALRRRYDWTRHFCLSAAIVLLSDERVSNAAGVLKEELDADTGGSGFSFADLLADRAGTTFAFWATRNEAAARAMQERIAGGFRVDDFFPPAADLPEGIADAEFQQRYGGVGGEQYRRVMDEIERRLAACPAYHLAQ